jgi:hypothetical protein
VTAILVAKGGHSFGLKDLIITGASIMGILVFNINPIFVIILAGIVGIFLY